MIRLTKLDFLFFASVMSAFACLAVVRAKSVESIANHQEVTKQCREATERADRLSTEIEKMRRDRSDDAVKKIGRGNPDGPFFFKQDGYAGEVFRVDNAAAALEKHKSEIDTLKRLVGELQLKIPASTLGKPAFGKLRIDPLPLDTGVLSVTTTQLFIPNHKSDFIPAGD